MRLTRVSMYVTEIHFYHESLFIRKGKMEKISLVKKEFFFRSRALSFPCGICYGSEEFS